MMRYRLLGRSGIRVSEFALGTMTFGEDWGWGAPKETSRRILDVYADAGGNFIDTADKYTDGSSEEFLGELLEGKRERFVVATKYTLQTVAGDVNSAGNHRKNLVTSLEASLKRLRADYIDLFWVHARDTLTPLEEVMRALDDQVRAGKVLAVGVSDWPAWEVSAANSLADLRGWSPFVGLQLEYSLLQRTVERDLLPMARAFDLAVCAWSPLAGGLLTGKYLDAGGQTTGRMAGGQPDERVGDIVGELVKVAEELGVSPAQVALAWLLRQPGNVVPIIGATKEQQIVDNLGALDVELSTEHRSRLDRASRVDLGFPHDFLQRENIKDIVYGDRRAFIDDRRTVHARRQADDLTEEFTEPQPS